MTEERTSLPDQSTSRGLVRDGGRATMRFSAECESCQARFNTGNRSRDRMAARRHAEREGHVVYAITERVTYYDGRCCPAEGCEFSPGHDAEHPHGIRTREA